MMFPGKNCFSSHINILILSMFSAIYCCGLLYLLELGDLILHSSFWYDYLKVVYVNLHIFHVLLFPSLID